VPLPATPRATRITCDRSWVRPRPPLPTSGAQPQDAVAGPRLADGREGLPDVGGCGGEDSTNYLGVRVDDGAVVAAGRQDERDVDPPVESVLGYDRRPFVFALANDRLESMNVGFHLEQDGLIAAIQAEVARPTARSWNGGLDSRPPGRVAQPEKTFHDPGMSRVMDQGRRGRIQAEPEVPAQRGCRSSSDPIRHAPIAGFQATDRRSVDPDRSGDRCLTHSSSKPDEAELLAEPARGPSKLTVTVVDRGSARHAGHGRTPGWAGGRCAQFNR